MPSSKDKVLISKIDAVLLRDWDPIGVGEHPEAKDEYTRYARTISKMLSDGRDNYAISKYLRELESGWKAAPANEERIEKVVQLILKCMTYINGV